MWVFDRELNAAGQIVEPEASGPEFVASERGELSTINNPGAITLDIRNPLTKESSPETTFARGDDCVVNYITKNTLINATFHRVKGVALTTTYWEESESQIGIGVYVQGKGWNVGGSVERKVSRGYGTKWMTNRTNSKFHYTAYRIKHTQCDFTCTSGPSCWYHYQEYRAVTHLGGNPSSKPRWGITTNSKNCRKFFPQGGGSEYKITYSKATTFKGGILLGPINLSAQSGYTKANGVHGDVREPRLICGWTGPPTAPGLVAVGKPRR